MSLILKRSLTRPYYFLKGDVEPIIRRAIARTLTYMPRDAPRRFVKNAQVQNGTPPDTVTLEECLLARAPTGEWYFPAGLLTRVLELLDSIEYDYLIENDVELPGDSLGLEWKSDKVLYDYQKEAAEIAYLNCGGTICLPTGGGKTLVALRLIYAFDHRTLILVHSRELMKQWRAAIHDTFGIDPGLVGGSFKENWDDITIASVQTIASRIKRGDVDAIDLNYPVLVADECLPYNTPVVTDIGMLPIGDIVEWRLPVKVLTHTGKYQKVVAYQKIPLVKRLVRVAHECGSFVCTEDHKINTQRGWVEAGNLTDGDVVFALTEEWGEKNGVCVQDLRKGIYTSKCHGGSYGEGTFAKCEGEPEPCVPVEIAGRQIEGCTDGINDTVRVSTRNRTHGSAETVDPRRTNGGHGHPLLWAEESVSTDYGVSLFETSRLCRVEILSDGESCEIASERNCHIWHECWAGRDQIPDPVVTVLNSNLRPCEERGEDDIKIERVVGRDRVSDCTRNLVPGRRIADPEERSISDPCDWAPGVDSGGVPIPGASRCDFPMAGNAMGNPGEDCLGSVRRSPEKLCEGGDIQPGRCRCVPGHCQTICGSVHAVQGDAGLYVYDVTVETDHSFVANGVQHRNCHHMPATDTYSVAMMYNSPIRAGLSATPVRVDGCEMKIFGAIGDICARITPVDLIRRGYLTEPRFVFLDPPYIKMRKTTDWQDVYYDGIVANQYRNQMIVDTARELVATGHKVYIHVERIEHGEILAVMFDDVSFIHGATPKKERDETIARFSGTEVNCLVSTLLGEGVDIPSMTAIIMAGGLKTQVGVVQKVGRALRKSPGKKEAVVVDFRDKGPFLARHFQARMDVYRETYGEYVDGKR